MAGTGGSEAAVALDELRSWWEVPAIAHFCSLFRTAFRLPDFEIEVRPRGPAPRRNSQNFPRAPPSLPSPPPSPGAGAGGAALFRRAPGRTKLGGGPRALGGVPVPGPKCWRREEGTARGPLPSPNLPGVPPVRGGRALCWGRGPRLAALCAGGSGTSLALRPAGPAPFGALLRVFLPQLSSGCVFLFGSGWGLRGAERAAGVPCSGREGYPQSASRQWESFCAGCEKLFLPAHRQ